MPDTPKPTAGLTIWDKVVQPRSFEAIDTWHASPMELRNREPEKLNGSQENAERVARRCKASFKPV